LKALIEKLTQVYGPSGFESNVGQVIRAALEPYVDRVFVDALGNVHAIKQGSAEGLKIMLAAHMDEIGLMITEVDKGGFARFTNIGGLFPLNLVGSRVVFGNGTVGVINVEGWETNPQLDSTHKKLYIDTGVSRREDTAVNTGDVAAFFGPFVDLGRRVVTKSLDDRIGCVVQIETIKRLQSTPHEIHFVFTVQEEVGVRGARTSAYRVDPDIAIAVDVTPSGDLPETKNFPVYLGKGPAIKVMDRQLISHPRIKQWMIDTAEAEKIPYQLEVLTLGSTDAAAMQIARDGTAAGVLSIPCRHVHTPSEMVDLDDVENAVKLLVAMLAQPVDLGLD
jgi:tetrahedral aminopeptidase